MFLPCSLVKIKYCVEPPSQRRSVFDLKPLGHEFRIVCHLIHLIIIKMSPWTSLAYKYGHKGGLKPHSFYSNITAAGGGVADQPCGMG